MPQKSLKIFGSALVTQDQDSILKKLIPIMLKVFYKNKMDMYLVQRLGNKSVVKSCGYKYSTGELDDNTILKRCNFAIKRNFWLKIDTYNDCYVGTFLYPENYYDHTTKMKGTNYYGKK